MSLESLINASWLFLSNARFVQKSQLYYQIAEDLSRLPCGSAARSGIQWKSVCLIRQQTHYHMVVCSWSDVCSYLHSVFASDATELPFS